MPAPSTSTIPAPASFTPSAIQQARLQLLPFIRETPAWLLQGHRVAALAPNEARIWLKLELFQHTGSFKPRGCLLVMQQLTAEQRARGVVATSAGNHGMAVAYAARSIGCHAKVAMPATASPARIAACQALGAEVILLPDIAAAFAAAEAIAAAEGRSFVHPFEGERTALGTATLGLEFLRQTGQLDALFVAIGGGGLAAGVACAVKQLQPRCRVVGVEPRGADSMTRSLAAGSPQRIERVATIADSLGAPMAMPYSFGLCQRYLDEVMLVDDDEICRAMALLFADGKLAVEPAGAAAMAAVMQQSERYAGQRIGVIVCGANVDPDLFQACLQRGRDGVL